MQTYLERRAAEAGFKLIRRAKADLERFACACQAATTLFAGGFRPCARPFIAHCAGTASALVAFGFAPHIVGCGMLHAAYSHAPLGPQPSRR